MAAGRLVLAGLVGFCLWRAWQARQGLLPPPAPGVAWFHGEGPLLNPLSLPDSF